MLNFFFVFLATITPVWFNLIFLIPISMVLVGYLEILLPIITSGDIDIQTYDLLILIAVVKTLYINIYGERSLKNPPLIKPILIFSGTIFFFTFISLFRFGNQLFLIELSSYLRLILLFTVYYILYYSINNSTKLSISLRAFHIIGYLIALTVYSSFIIYVTTGIKFGEIHDSRELIRFFGPIGDQVGFILIVFAFKEFLDKNLMRSIFFTLPILATGTRGAIIALLFGIFYIFIKKIDWKSTFLIFILVFSIITLILGTGFGQMVSARFFNADVFEEGFSQRTFSMGIGISIFFDNLLTGIGYNGFHIIAQEYDVDEAVKRFGLSTIANSTNQYIQIATDAGVSGLIVYILLLMSFYRKFQDAAGQTGTKDNNLFIAGKIWLISLLLANQTAVWIVPGTLIGYLFLILLSLASVYLTVYGTESHSTKSI